MSDVTPTESLIGYDANGIPDRHTSPASRQHTDQHEDTTRIILPGPQLPPQAIRQSVSHAEVLRAHGHESPDVRPIVSLPHRDDLAYMAPEAVEAMLRRCNHACRTHGCGTVVALCGSFCEDCQTEIACGKFDAVRWEKILAWTLIALSLVVSGALVWKGIFG